MQINEKTNKFLSGLLAGGLASFLTQPLEVIKTIILINPLKNPIIEQGYTLKSLKNACFFIYSHENRGIRNFFRGGLVACLRQALGFAIYTHFISVFSENLAKTRGNKYINAGISACFAKILAVSLTSPLILIKTRLELITQREYADFRGITREILKEGRISALFTGVSSVLSREIAFSAFHYSFYRFLMDNYKPESASELVFVAYFAGFFAIFVSHPFEVVRNRIMIPERLLVEEKKYKGLAQGLRKIVENEGILGFFKGILPRLARKPVNSAIVWSVYEARNRGFVRNAQI